MKKGSLLMLLLAAVLVVPAVTGIAVGQEPDPNPPAGEPAEQPPQSPPAQTEPPQAAVAAPVDENLKKGKDLNAAKQYSQAEAALRAAVAAQPDNPDAHFQLGVALFEQGKVNDAEKEIQQAQALAQGPESQQADFYQYRGAVYARQEKWNESVQDLEKAIKLDPMRPYNHYYIGMGYSKVKRPDKMVEHLQMFLKLAPNAPEAPKCKALLRAVQ
ncbi:MAG: tetratricopeptide repeat protein [Acidobacteria bacterium]|nr:MAG: tetratricopeptide repeat protein [Acidobacteriota bacterium]